MKVTGCIVTYNNLDTIQTCINSIIKYTKNIDFQLYISDNGSIDGTVEWIAINHPEIKIMKNDANLGFGEGHNRILRYLDEGYHFIINPDIIIHDNIIKKSVDFMEKNFDVAMMTPKILNKDGSEQYLPKRAPTIRYVMLSKLKYFTDYRKEYTRQLECFDHPVEIEFCTGCFLCIRTELFKQIKGFDKRFFMYFEDADLSRRVLKKGQIIYNPEMFVYHEWNRDNVKTFRGRLRFLKSLICYFLKWGIKF